MQSQARLAATSPAQPASTAPSELDRKSWEVKFVVPSPQAMPSDRMKARAELVRNALGCGTY